MTDDQIYFGRPGALQVLPEPKGGREITRLRRRSSFDLGSGGVRTATIVGGKRAYTLNWNALDYASFAYLESIDQGHQGPGPFVYLDPSRRNMLTANQSGATSETNDASNFTVAGTGGSLGSEAVIVKRGPRSLKWTMAIGAPATATVSLDSPTVDFPGIPVAIRSYAFQVQARAGGTDSSVTLQAKLSWLDASGAPLSSALGNATACASGAWTPVLVAAVAPAGAAYCNATVVASGATVTAGAIVYLDELQLVEGTAPDASWTPGTGVPAVDVVSLSEKPPWGFTQYRSGPVLVLQEVGG
jgi:hypothetical protein